MVDVSHRLFTFTDQSKLDDKDKKQLMQLVRGLNGEMNIQEYDSKFLNEEIENSN